MIEETADGAPGGAGAPADPGHHPGRRHRLLRATAFAAALVVPVAVLALLVRAKGSPLVALDEAAIRAGTDLTRENPALRDALLAWQTAFQARWLNLVVALVCLWAWRRHGLRTRALWALVTLLVTWNLGLLAKYVVQRARPVVDDAITLAPGYSFPSGHVTNAASAGLTLVILLWPLLGRRARVAVPVAVGAAVVVTGADRVLLGAHYPTDVVAGVLLGTAMAGASYLGYLGRHPAAPGTSRVPKELR